MTTALSATLDRLSQSGSINYQHTSTYKHTNDNRVMRLYCVCDAAAAAAIE